MTRFKLLPCLIAKCNAVWLRDMNSPRSQYVEVYWKRLIPKGEEAFICNECYSHVCEVIARQSIRTSAFRGLETWTDPE